jgi:phage I-like protein
MALTTFDTHELVKDLKAAGFNDTQAEAVTQAVKNAREIDLSDLATKAEITALRADIALLATKLDNIAANYATKAELSVCGTTLFAGH